MKTLKFSLYELGESVLGNGLSLAVLPIYFGEKGVNLLEFNVFLSFINLSGFLFNVFLLKASKNIEKSFVIFSFLTFLLSALFSLSVKNFLLSVELASLLGFIHFNALLLYQVSILSLKDLKLGSSISSVFGYFGLLIVSPLGIFIKSYNFLIFILAIIYLALTIPFLIEISKEKIYFIPDFSFLKDKKFLKFFVLIGTLAVPNYFFNSAFSLYLKTIENLSSKDIYKLLFLGLLFAIAGSFLSFFIWKRISNKAFLNICLTMWILVYINAYFFKEELITLAILGGISTGLFWTFFKAITALIFKESSPIKIVFLYGTFSFLGPLFYIIFAKFFGIEKGIFTMSTLLVLGIIMSFKSQLS